MSTTKYAGSFYVERDHGTRVSASVVAGHVMDLIGPRSVIDLGCGVGTWLDVFRELGAERIQGLEGPWLDRANLVIDPSNFQHWDLREVYRAEARFDLAMSLEVGEHLPASKCEALVDSLTGSAPVVLFGAAIPHQGGVDHVNEQWQSYWKERFEKRGFRCFDVLRPRVWNDQRVKVWYKQNTLLYVHAEQAAGIAEKLNAYDTAGNGMIDVVHPDLFLRQVSYRHPMHVAYKDLVRYFPAATWAAIKRAMRMS